MITTIHSYGGVTTTVYVMNDGEKIPRHQHTWAHTTSVAAGQTEVEMWTHDDTKGWLKPMWPGEHAFELPPNIDHEIRALVDGTVVVNLSVGGPQTVANAMRGEPAQTGGIALHDGTVVDAA
jgi:quercetin dioxygenase-like cupin family protein